MVPRKLVLRHLRANIRTATKLFLYAMLHWEDFGPSHGRRIMGNISAQEFDRIVVPAYMVGNPHKDLAQTREVVGH